MNSLGAKKNLSNYHDSIYNFDALHSEKEQYSASYTTAQQSKSPKSLQHTISQSSKRNFHTLNLTELEPNKDKLLSKNFSRSTKSLKARQFHNDDKHYQFCDDDTLTSHYYHNNKTIDDKRGKKLKR